MNFTPVNTCIASDFRVDIPQINAAKTCPYRVRPCIEDPVSTLYSNKQKNSVWQMK